MEAKSDNTIPSLPIRIDKEGIWYYQGAEMFRMEIVNLFYEHLRKDEQGRYIIEFANDCSLIEVEDAPYVVKAVYANKNDTGDNEHIELVFNNATKENLDPATLRIGKDNVLYCSVRNGYFDARFSRVAYYQLAELIDYDESCDCFYLFINNKRYYIKDTNLPSA